MKAFAIDRYKGDLTPRDVPDPVPGPGEVVVAIAATSVNPIDFKLRDGEFKAILPQDMPLTLGLDLAGTVIATGADVTRFKVGDEVFARPADDHIGTFAERIAVAEADLALKPKSLDMTEAGALPLTALTAWQVLVERAQVKRGDKVLIHAGSGGVGTVAIQLAKHLGATVAATAGTDNLDLVRSLGADVAIDYRNEDFTQRLSGYDVVLNTLGPDVLEKSLAVLKPGGKLISISGPPDPAFARAVGANWFVRQVLRLASFKIRHKAKKRGVDYSFLFMHADGAQLARIAELVDDGVLRPVIDKEFPFDRTPEAVARVEQGHGAGKVVIEVAEDGPATGADARAVATPIGIEPAVVPDRSDTLTTGRLALLASLAALGALATNIMLPAFPAIALELGVAPRELAWTLSSFFIVFAVGQLFVGPLSDTLGRARLVLGGLIVFVAGSIVCTLAPSLPVLIAGRAIQALGACAASVLARAIARDLYHGPELTRALALVMIAMAAAPGFSPALGTGMTLAFGWRSTFVLVAVAGVLVALHYRLGAGETLPVDRRRPAHPLAIARTYRDLSIDPRFIAPALTVSLIIGCLYSFFGAAPAILMTGMGLSSTGLSIFFAATVLVVFGSGLLTGRLVARWGAPRVGMAGLLVAAVGGLWLLLQGGAAAPAPFMAAVTLFLAGMGFVNPVGTAIALEPFGDRAGIASALLGFLQMSCAAIGTALIGALPVSPATAYAWVVFGGTLLATGAFLPAMGIRYTTVSRSEVEP